MDSWRSAETVEDVKEIAVLNQASEKRVFHYLGRVTPMSLVL